MTDTRHADAVVIGAGFGGIGAAMTLAEAGADVVVLEAMSYPGGCASTFRRGGHEFESGATVLTGFGPNQLFGRWIARHAVDVDVQPLDPVMTLHARGRVRPVPADKAAWVGALGPGAQGVRGVWLNIIHIAGRAEAESLDRIATGPAPWPRELLPQSSALLMPTSADVAHASRRCRAFTYCPLGQAEFSCQQSEFLFHPKPLVCKEP